MKLTAIFLMLFVLPAHAGYMIYTYPQVVPKYTTVYGANGPTQVLTALPTQPYPIDCGIFWQTDNVDRYAADPARRTVLLWCELQGTATEEQILYAFPTILDAKKAKLLKACNEAEASNISGIGLSVLSIGVAQGLPKSLAVAAWSDRLWNGAYFTEKSHIRFDAEPDYGVCAAVGSMPFTVQELGVEVWGK